MRHHAIFARLSGGQEGTAWTQQLPGLIEAKVSGTETPAAPLVGAMGDVALDLALVQILMNMIVILSAVGDHGGRKSTDPMTMLIQGGDHLLMLHLVERDQAHAGNDVMQTVHPKAQPIPTQQSDLAVPADAGIQVSAGMGQVRFQALG